MMKRYLLVGILLLNFLRISSAQIQSEVLFRFADKEVTRDEVMYVLELPSDSKKEITVEEFNRALNYYLSIYDFKATGLDTTKLFKKRLALQSFNILGNIYAAKNRKAIIKKYMIPYDSFAVVKDLSVPFDPLILRSINELKENESASFDAIAEYATSYEGTSVSTRIIAPFEASFSLSQAVSELLEGTKKQSWIGPLKGVDGYHYLQFLREQPNFGRYEMQLIFVSDREGKGKKEIEEAYKKLQEGEDFRTVAQKYSELYNSEKDSLLTYYYLPSISTNDLVVSNLKELKDAASFSEPFFASKGWYILKKISWQEYPTKQNLERQILRIIRKPSFFLEELKKKYKVEEFPYNFLSGRDDVLFLIAEKPYYAKDLENYAKEYGYDITTETYGNYLSYLLAEEYKKELEGQRYERLLNDFYFMNTIGNFMPDRQKAKEQFIKKLKQLVVKYKPIITNPKYVENNPVFEK